MLKPLTETEKKEAVLFFLTHLRGKSTDEITKARKQNFTQYRNWCRIHSQTEYEDEWQELLKGDKEKKETSYERIKRAEIKKKQEEFIREHLIRKEDYEAVKFKIVKDEELTNDEYISLAIPFDNMRYWVPRFWWSVEVYKSKNPKFFERVKKTFEVYNGEAEIMSNSAFYNTKIK